jgi:CHAD domain-containing protein
MLQSCYTTGIETYAHCAFQIVLTRNQAFRLQEEYLERAHLPQSKVIALPPPSVAAPAVVPSATQVASPWLPPPPPQRPAEATDGFNERLSLRPPGTPKHGPVAVGPYLAQGLDGRWQSYRRQLRKCQEKFSEGAVHELRVATRRLLAHFTLLSCLAPSGALEKARRVLKRQLTSLGDLRDTHVQRLFVEQKTATYPELLLLRSWLKRRERRLVESAAEKVDRFKTGKLEKWIFTMTAELMADAGGKKRQCRLEPIVLRATAQAFAEVVDRRRAIDLADPITIHKTRVAFKRFRYMVESLSPGLTRLTKRQLRTLAYYQRKMGIIQDLEVLQAFVAGYVRENEKGAALLRPFCRHLRQRRARALRSFVKTADRLFGFWPPAALASRGWAAATRHAP